ncbi:Rieske (2Fe-2S) protein [Actinotalea ferrariae]|uniref:Rieske (2Fe-2S) protein n=1 Tax=Actinotalea ferrariae TaxID=1386098 RepID=UPI001C8BFEAF|nr:Rieske (2Fe-2S) protein [Actinotalea ferrariae]MBX9244823.1 Rieske (2Fe-2S) protein [Actinotalea ferrariae]
MTETVERDDVVAATCAGACARHGGASRRAFLAGSVAAAGAVALVACAPGGGDGGGTPTGDAAGGDGEGSGSGGLVALADVPVGGAVVATTSAGDTVLVTQPTEGEVRCFSSVCTHQGCAVAPGEGELKCPCHASAFHLDTGEPVMGPATRPLDAVAVEVRDGQVVEA